MSKVNIFMTIKKVTSRIEPFHSRFLAETLCESLTSNRALFDEFWRLSAPEGWDVPAQATVTPEYDLCEHGRIDVCIHSESPSRVLGIEVKTTDSSVTEGQLRRYRDGLNKKHESGAVAVAYLTPFNKERAGEFAALLPTVEEHKRFSREFPDSRHVSWLDVADIAWEDGNELWQQHRAFVESEISNYATLRTRSKRDRSFNVFFGDAAADVFWEKLAALGIESSTGSGARVPLGEINDVHAFVGAFEELIATGERIKKQRQRNHQFPKRDLFVRSRFGKVHRALFELACQFTFVWIQGKENYGVRVAHDTQAGSVSLVRSLDKEHLLIGQSR